MFYSTRFLHDSCQHGDPGESNAPPQRSPWIARRSLGGRASKKGRPAGAAPHVLCLACRRRGASPDVGDAFLSFRFGRSGGLRGQLKHGGLLAFDQFGQEDHLPIRKFKGIMMRARLVFVDLPEDRRPGGHSARTEAEETGCCTGDLLGERKLRSRKDAHRCRGIFGRSEPTSTSMEVGGGPRVEISFYSERRRWLSAFRSRHRTRPQSSGRPRLVRSSFSYAGASVRGDRRARR